MPKPMRLKVAREYLTFLASRGEPKLAMLAICDKYGITRRSVYRYVEESRIA